MISFKGVQVDHATLNRWVAKYSPLIASNARRRDKAAATKFFARALEVNGLPCKIVIDKSAANTTGITAINRMLKRFGCPIAIELVRIKYLNIIVEQDDRTIKKRNRPMLGFKSFVSASATLEGIDVANMIR
jgi:putative transposase